MCHWGGLGGVSGSAFDQQRINKKGLKMGGVGGRGRTAESDSF